MIALGQRFGQNRRALAGRVALGLLFAAFLFVVFTKSAANAVRVRDPEAALRLDPSNALALAAVAERRIRPGMSDKEIREVVDLAKAAIARDPGASSAFTTLAITGSVRGGPSHARSLVKHADALSRRDLPTQLWLIEDAVQRSRVAEALFRYDVALRTSRLAPSILFPVLVGAADDAALIEPLVDRLARGPVWAEQFLLQLAQSGQDLPNIARLYVSLLRRGRDPGGQALAVASARMVERGLLEDAWRLYATRHPSADRRAVRDASFMAVPTHPTPFDWRLSDDPSLNVVPGQGLEFDAATGAGGALAEQTLLLPNGRYRLVVVSDELAAPGSVTVELSCIGRREILAQLDPRPASEVATDLSVPAGCVDQSLAVKLRSSDVVLQSGGTIRRISLTSLPR